MKAKNPETGGYKEYSGLDLPVLEKEVLAFWEQESIFQKSIESRPESNRFVFYEGPPSANGMPGIHHVMSRTIKDLFCRYKTLKGFRVERKAGWDTHGLPVELNVEKSLGITKKDIGVTITVAEYNRHCREDVLRYTDKWNDLTQKMGYWVDMEHPYITYTNNYIESLWALLKRLYEKGLLYKGYTIQPYSPAAGTGLSSHELNQPGCYRDVKDTSAIAMFKVIKNADSAFLFNKEEETVHILAWTTTPWTLPSNTALAVGGGVNYVKVKTTNFYSKKDITVILAADLLEKVFAWNNLPVLEAEEIGVGATLAGIRYEQLLPYAQPKDGDAFRVIIGDFVTTTDGTGVVHIAPSFGADDMRVAKQNGIGSLTLVDRQGRFTPEVTDCAGEFVKEDYYTAEEKEETRIKKGKDKYLNVDIQLVTKLKEEEKLFKTERYEHSYPHCWRTDKSVIYYPLDSWFIKTTAIKDRLVELNKTINWKPASTGEGRFGQWLENLVDWNLSRSRYWGTPLPIWRTEDGLEEKCIGSIEELKAEITKAGSLNTLVEITDLHKPFVDEIILLSDSGKPMKRETDLIDAWFDSGAMPYAQWHYPLENEELFKQNFPADFIAEGVDQTRGWFFTLHVLGVALFDSVAYYNVLSNGLLLDAKGQKMSKRLGNFLDPFQILEKYGADATRWYMMSNSNPWDNLKFDVKALEETSRSHFGTLYNTYSFFALYANLDKWKYNESATIAHDDKPEIDRWILSKLQTLVKEVSTNLDDYEPMRAARSIELFVDAHLSNWYVRLCRRRFWKGEMSADKQAAYETLFECMVTVAQLMSPITPFFADWLYQNLTDAQESVHLTLLNSAKEEQLDSLLEERMEMAQQISSMVLSLRKKTLIKVRQPLQKILIPVSDLRTKEQLVLVEPYILSEVNVKEIEFVTDTTDMVRKRAKANFKTLGKKVGPKMKQVQEAVYKMSQTAIAYFERHKTYLLQMDSYNVQLEEDDLEIISEDIPGWLVANEGKITVALDVNITKELQLEGNAREFVNKVQNIRKDKGFQVLDRIRVSIVHNALFAETLALFKDYIMGEILATDINLVDSIPDFEELEVNETLLLLKIEIV